MEASQFLQRIDIININDRILNKFYIDEKSFSSFDYCLYRFSFGELRYFKASV